MVIETLEIGSKDQALPDRFFERGAPLAVSRESFEFVSRVADSVREKGDDAVVELTRKFDSPTFASPRISDASKAHAIAGVDDDVRKAIRHSIKNARRFNDQLVAHQKFPNVEVEPGVAAKMVAWPVQRAALYVPCGKGAYPSSFITIAVPAVAAGVPDLEILIPPKSDGQVDGAVLFAAEELGIRNVYAGNGVAVTLAAALGTMLLSPVDKIVGPGGPGIMAAQAYAGIHGVDVAKHFGPSECMVLADDSADAELVAADMINEAEHGPESSAILITDSVALGREVARHLAIRLEQVPEARRAYVKSALTNGAILVVPDLEVGADIANRLGNEHIQVVSKQADQLARQLFGGAEILVGQDTSFSAISYCIGVPACLPTGPSARRYSGVTALTFLRYSAVTSLTRAGLAGLADSIVSLSQYEGFPSHAESIALRRRRGLIP